MKWSLALPIETALEEGEGGEMDEGSGGSVEQNAYEKGGSEGVHHLQRFLFTSWVHRSLRLIFLTRSLLLLSSFLQRKSRRCQQYAPFEERYHCLKKTLNVLLNVKRWMVGCCLKATIVFVFSAPSSVFCCMPQLNQNKRFPKVVLTGGWRWRVQSLGQKDLHLTSLIRALNLCKE